MAYISLLVWAIGVGAAVNVTPYGIEENAAKALLLSWSIVDQVASSVVTFSAPDLRAVLFLPVAILWTGNVFAAKLFVVLVVAGTAALLFDWGRQRFGEEAAMLATGLLLIAPLTLHQVDAIGSGCFLLAAFAAGAFADRAYRAAPRAFGGWYFAQLALCALAVSLHPAGMAYPLALLWGWRDEPVDRAQQRYFYGGVGLVTLLTLLIRFGWRDVDWLVSPLHAGAAMLLGAVSEEPSDAGIWIAALLAGCALGIVLLRQFRALRGDPIGRSLLLGVIFGAAAADTTWAYLALALTLYFGFPLLLRSPPSDRANGFFRQRGFAVALLFIASIAFMHEDKALVLAARGGILSAEDQLIQSLATEVADERAAVADDREKAKQLHVRVASQWPSRTMIACKCDTLPLPPAAPNPEAQLNMLRTITLLLLDPKRPPNGALTANLAALGGRIETVRLQPGGVLLRIKASAATGDAPL